MAHSTGESESDALRLDFDRRLTLQFRADCWPIVEAIQKIATLHASPGVIWGIRA